MAQWIIGGYDKIGYCPYCGAKPVFEITLKTEWQEFGELVDKLKQSIKAELWPKIEQLVKWLDSICRKVGLYKNVR